MNDTIIIVIVVLLMGVVAGVVFVIWRTRYQPLGRRGRSSSDLSETAVVKSMGPDIGAGAWPPSPSKG